MALIVLPATGDLWSVFHTVLWDPATGGLLPDYTGCRVIMLHIGCRTSVAEGYYRSLTTQDVEMIELQG